MLIEFKFSNFRSFRDETCLSMRSVSPAKRGEGLLPCEPGNLLPAVAISGKNGEGKTNVIRAFAFAVQFICNTQRTQHESASIPVELFLLDDISQSAPASFEFTYILDGFKYIYGFAATKEKIEKEYLYQFPKGRKALVSAVEHTLGCGGVFLVDGLEEHLHPLLERFMLSKFQSLDSNPNHAQIIFTTHSTDLLNSGLLQKGQIYVASKGKRDNSSTLTLITSEVKATGGIHHVD